MAIIRTEINPNEFDENAYDKNYPELSAEELFLKTLENGKTQDQILILDSCGNILTERRDLSYAKFRLGSN